MGSPFEEQHVIPDVIDEVPPHTLRVTYDRGPEIATGQTLTPTQVQHQPEVSYPTDQGALYTICMTDPDAPSRENPRYREWHHWLVVNVPGTTVANGEILSEYIGACPPRGTGLHRYVIVVYKQPERLTCDEKRLTAHSGERRCNFKIRDFAKKYHLGAPVSANFYLAEYDEHVPKIYDQLSGD
ncbi:protein D2-like [Haemaphysalis longicornis]